MRPHKLIMKAFGPFAKETVVEFDSMGDNIYLISGDTGAGKTTIFDGIIYALYGTASGGARSGLVTEAFHSDYAKDGKYREEMRVELVFSNAGRTFTAVRRMYWGKKGDAQKAIKESALSENGNIIVNAKGREDKDDVTLKVTELLGLDADQFRRIIMLAQGEFQKFLTAKSDERGVILGKLYDNRQHQDFQMRLKAARELLKSQDDNLVEEEKAQIKFFAVPEAVEEEKKENIAVNHPLLLQTAKGIIDDMKAELESLGKSIQDREKVKEDLSTQKTKGEERNRLFDVLEGKKTEIAELDNKKEEMNFLRGLIDRAESAEKVIPSETTWRNEKISWCDCLKKIQNLEKEHDRLAKCLSELKNAADEVETKNTPDIKQLREKQIDLQKALPIYDELAKSIADLEEKEKALRSADKAVGNAEEMLSQKKRRRDELTDELKRLESAGASAVQNAKRDWDDARKRQAGLNDIQEAIADIQVMTAELSELALALNEAQKKELEAETRHLQLNTRFIQGQAGILAQDMREKLQSQAKVTCPVCGAVHSMDSVSSFAEWHEEIPTKEAVDEAYADLNKAHNDAQTADKNHSNKKKDLETQKKLLREKSEHLICDVEWDELEEGSILSDAITECEELVTSAKAKYDRAVSDKTAKEKATTEKNTVEAEVVNADNAVKEAEKAKGQAKTDAVTAETTVSNLEKRLQGFPENKEKAERMLSFYGDQIDSLKKQIDDAKKELEQCKTDQALNKGNLSSANIEKNSRAQSKENAEKAFLKQLEKNGFDDIDAYHAALSPEATLLDQDTISTWIKENKSAVEEFEQNHRELSIAIEQLEKSTKNMKRVDVQALATKIGDISAELDKDKGIEKNLATYVHSNDKVYKELCRIREAQDKYRKVFAKLNPLADTADGKYAFSRYVLTGFFHRIVEQANIHLETMTDGEYCLVPKETGDGRTSIGLELKVLNTITNLERDTASLSGGQLFEASLSLALGLSDVVQMESTSSVQIDSMFIDEGFGSLDGGRLDKSIEVLRHLLSGKRQIGIISHVARLDECLPKKIHVVAGGCGSTVRIETDG